MPHAGIRRDTVPREELLRRASALVPRLRERAASAEQLRRIPPESVHDLQAAGLIRIGNPERYGGQGIEIDVAFDVAWELGRGCGSTAWCYALWTVHNWWLGHFPERAQEDFFASGPDTLFSSGLDPTGGKALPVDGGCRLTGRWRFSSGCDAATWAMVATLGDRNELYWLLVPCADYEIVDTWFASGMRGTGSKDIVITDAFVPAHRTLQPNRAGDGDFTGWELHRRLSYRVPLRCLTGWDLAAPLVGIAQGAIDEFTARLQGTSGPGRTAASVPLQMRLAEAAAEVDAARALHRHDIHEMLDRAARGGLFTD
ncbi:MAG TPA: acyl-CoA dehydrogenase family protein, partial [Candidatus Methylomirabilis sp.]|nr:acyl-CoA dehydrogenase family protein [Candidatus Methylomirabilis sp.]